jgi:polyisoprenoid-binding protein YceI
MITGNQSVRVLLACLLLMSAGIVKAVEGDLCEPFRDSAVDEVLVERMLTAADNGYLYRIVAKSSRVGFCVDSEFNTVEGVFRDFRGGLALGAPNSSDGQTMVVVRADSLDTNGAVIESVIKSKRFFDVDEFPEILFVSNGFEWTSERTAVLKGDLTLHGVTRPVTFTVELSNLTEHQAGTTDRVLFKATTVISRAAFGMDALPSVIKDQVKLCLSVEAQKYRG